MPDDIRISDLSPVSAITNGALMELSNEDSGAETGYVSVKMTITQLATKLNVSMEYLTDLLTTNKTIAGAINEVNDKLKTGTSAPTSLMGNDGDFYLQYTEGTGGADDEVDAFYVKLDGVWCQISTGGGGGSGGHTILDNSGTALTQRTNLQFKGAYSEDNSGDDTTEVNVVRSMTKAQYNQLSADEKVGIINITDENITATDLPISANDPTDTKSYIDTGLSGKAKKTWTALGTITEGGTALNISGYSELLIYPKINGTTYFNTYVVDVAEFSNTSVIHFSIYQDSTHSYMGALDYSSNTINLRKVLIAGWTNCVCIVKAR